MVICKKLFFINSIFLLIVAINSISCETREKVTYDIHWRLFGDFSDVEIGLFFENGDDYSKDYEFTLIPLKTKKISMVKGSRYTGDSIFPYGTQFKVYPRLDDATTNSIIEIYVYKPLVEVHDGYFVMERYDDIEAYFVMYSQGGKIYEIISADNVLIKNEIKIVDDFDLIMVLEEIKKENFHYHNEWGAMLRPDVPLGGYIVKSKIDDNYVWLTTNQW